MKTEKITIKTRLNSGISLRPGQLQVETCHEFNVGPKNLLGAIKTLTAHSAQMVVIYGGIGHAGSWIEINGVEITQDEILEFLMCDGFGGPMKWARQTLANRQSQTL